MDTCRSKDTPAPSYWQSRSLPQGQAGCACVSAEGLRARQASCAGQPERSTARRGRSAAAAATDFHSQRDCAPQRRGLGRAPASQRRRPAEPSSRLPQSPGACPLAMMQYNAIVIYLYISDCAGRRARQVTGDGAGTTP